MPKEYQFKHGYGETRLKLFLKEIYDSGHSLTSITMKGDVNNLSWMAIIEKESIITEPVFNKLEVTNDNKPKNKRLTKSKASNRI